LIANFAVKFGEFFHRKHLLLFLGKIFLVTDITKFSSEAKETWKWVKTTKIQIEIIIVPSKMRNCAVPPDIFNSEISFTLESKCIPALQKMNFHNALAKRYTKFISV